MIEHSVFALPFAYIAALTAMWQQTRSVHWVQLLLITIAMVSARTVAMAANRILDRRFDALNPRTARRELVTGELDRACRLDRHGHRTGRLPRRAPPRCRGAASLLAPIAVGAARALLLRQAVHRLSAGVAGDSRSSWRRSAPGWRSPTRCRGPQCALGLAVGTWIGGFDLIYSCQDAEIDRRIGSRSFPARFGIPAALRHRRSSTS